MLLKFPSHHFTLHLPPVTSHHSKKSALNTLNNVPTSFCSIQREEAKQTHLLNSPSGLLTFPIFHKSFKFYRTQWDEERVAPYVTRPGGYPVGCQYHSATLTAGSKIRASNSGVHQRTSKTASLGPETWDLPMLNLDCLWIPGLPLKSSHFKQQPAQALAF